jgi:hypothetical protein
MGYIWFFLYVWFYGDGSSKYEVRWFVMNKKDGTWPIELEREKSNRSNP